MQANAKGEADNKTEIFSDLYHTASILHPVSQASLYIHFITQLRFTRLRKRGVSITICENLIVKIIIFDSQYLYILVVNSYFIALN